MSSITISSNFTEFTDSYDKVFMETAADGTRQLRRLIFHRKTLTNPNQLDHIIHYLVVMNNFLMTSCTNELIKFECSTNPDVYYEYYPQSNDFVKVCNSYLVDIE